MPSYSELVTQIASLKKKADKARRSELSSVIKSIKQQIRDYGIRYEDIRSAFSGAGSTEKPSSKRARSGVKVSPKSRQKLAPKYMDGNGNTWTGRGKKPVWLSNAIAQGATVESFLITNQNP